MSAVSLHASVQEEILALKRERKAIILAHHYQESEIQELADVIGDSLELARKAKQFDGEVIVFCGVWFMAETAKLLNPERIVVVPEAKAGCSLVDSCPVEQLRAFKQRHPDHVVVSYINTSAAVKAESDIICTSRNAVQVVYSIPAEKPVLFCPDINLGNYVKQQTGRGNMRIWQGACIVHATFAARRLTATKMEHPGALVAAHPECPAEVLAMRTTLVRRRRSSSIALRARRVSGSSCRKAGCGIRLRKGRRARSFTSWPTRTAIAANVRLCE